MTETSLNRDDMEKRRLEAVQDLLRGLTQSNVARKFGVSRTTVFGCLPTNARSSEMSPAASSFARCCERLPLATELITPGPFWLSALKFDIVIFNSEIIAEFGFTGVAQLQPGSETCAPSAVISSVFDGRPL